MNPVDIAHLVNAIDLSNYEPNSWERKFLRSMRDNILAGKYATPKQAEMLQKIYRKSAGGEKPQERQRI